MGNMKEVMSRDLTWKNFTINFHPESSIFDEQKFPGHARPREKTPFTDNIVPFLHIFPLVHSIWIVQISEL